MADKEWNDDELDEFITKEVDKDIDQSDSIDQEVVESSIGEMGFLWNQTRTKLEKDAYCFDCKRTTDFASEKMHVLQASKTDMGVVAFVSVCEPCFKKLDKETKKNAK